MKPDWKDAPEWANWLAMDADGEWVWHEDKPYKKATYWSNRRRAELACADGGWESSLAERPSETRV